MNTVPTPLALDHLTVSDTRPSELVAVAADCGYRAVCLFLEPLAVLPRMPAFAVIGDTPERRETRRRCVDFGVSIDLAYPFTLASRTELRAFRPAMETAAWLEVGALNTLIYDREPQRRLDNFAGFCELAGEYGLGVAVEFYPLSQVRSLGEALELVGRIGPSASVGVNIDLLHLIRSGGRIEELASLSPDRILYGQYCDGPYTLDPQQWGWEASSDRLLPGEGEFDIRQFARSLPPGTRCSVEVPRDREIAQGITGRERAARALIATRRAMDGPRRGPEPY